MGWGDAWGGTTTGGTEYIFEQLSVIQGIQVAIENSQNWEITWNLSPPLSVISNPNLLTENQSSMETDTSGWVLASGSAFIWDVISGTVPYVGTYCLGVISTGFSPPGEIVTTPYDTAAVTVGQTYRVSAYTRSYYTSLAARAIIEWLNSGGTVISQSLGTVGGPWYGPTGPTTEWVRITAEGVAPSGTAYARPRIYLAELEGIGRPMYVDAVELRHVGA